MAQFFGSENIPSPVVASTTTLTLAASNLGLPTVFLVGGQAYTPSGTITLNTATTGANGLDTGALSQISLYYIYAIVHNSTFVPALVASLAVPNTGPSMPSGYGSAYKLVGNFNTNGSSQVVSASSASAFLFANGMDDATATRLGLKQYLHGTTYNGGNAPTVTLGFGGGTLTSVTRALFVPYQMQDGTWRLKFNAVLAPSSTSRISVQFAVFGVVSKNVSYQAIIATTTAASQLTTGYATPGTGTIMVADHNGAAVTSTFYSFSGDIELESKPTWAY